MEYDTDSGFFNGIHHNYHGLMTGTFHVSGYKDPDGNTMSWSLGWQTNQLDSCAVISWSGQTQYLANGDPVILTTWLVTQQTDPEHNWNSTLIGTDQFYSFDDVPSECQNIADNFKGNGSKD